jgi:hypothetical protein
MPQPEQYTFTTSQYTVIDMLHVKERRTHINEIRIVVNQCLGRIRRPSTAVSAIAHNAKKRDMASWPRTLPLGTLARCRDTYPDPQPAISSLSSELTSRIAKATLKSNRKNAAWTVVGRLTDHQGTTVDHSLQALWLSGQKLPFPVRYPHGRSRQDIAEAAISFEDEEEARRHADYAWLAWLRCRSAVCKVGPEQCPCQ